MERFPTGFLFAGALWTQEEIDAAIRGLIILAVAAVAVVVSLINIARRGKVGPGELFVFAVIGVAIAYFVLSAKFASWGEEEYLAAFDSVVETRTELGHELETPYFISRTSEIPCPRSSASMWSGPWREHSVGANRDLSMLDVVRADAQSFEDDGWAVRRFVGDQPASLLSQVDGWSFVASNGQYTAGLLRSPGSGGYSYSVWPSACEQLNSSTEALGDEVDRFPSSPLFDTETLWSNSHKFADIFPDGSVKAEGGRIVVGLGLDEVCSASIVRLADGDYGDVENIPAAIDQAKQHLLAARAELTDVGEGTVVEYGSWIAVMAPSVRRSYEFDITVYTKGCGEYSIDAAIEGLQASTAK